MTWTAETITEACRALVPGYDPWDGADAFTFDVAAALRVVGFFKDCLTFTNARWLGKPFELQPWQAAIIGNLFGWKRQDGTRRYRKCLIFTARKSGKTELAAGIGLVLLFADREPAAEIVCCAGNADQARKIFKAASTMVKNKDSLLRRAKLLVSAIDYQGTDGTLKVINSEAKTKHGGNLHGALIDELHVHADSELVDTLVTSMGARAQPLTVYTTTAGEDPESIAGEVYDYAVRVRDRVIHDPVFLPAVFEVPKAADISDPAVWQLAQPNLGTTVPIEKYQTEYQEALSVPRKMRVFRQLSLNQWTEAASTWMNLDAWRACGKTVDLASLKGKPATLGIDLSSTTDTTAIVAAVRDGQKVVIIPFVFIPKDSASGDRISRERRDRAPYGLWLEQGHIIATPGNTVDYRYVERKIVDLSKELGVCEIQADAWSATDLLTRLKDDHSLPVLTVRQGYTLSAATKETERLVLAGDLIHPNNPALNWQVSNAATKSDEHDNIWLNKKKSYSRIDAPVAMIMAINGLVFGKGKDGSGKPMEYLRFL